MITVTSDKTSRAVEVTREQYAKRGTEIVHYVEGGDIDVFASSGWRIEVLPAWSLSYEYRIKLRAPKAGEVWMDGDDPCLICYGLSEDHTMFYNNLDGERVAETDCRGFTYSAPSVEAYIARKIISEAGGNSDSNIALKAVSMSSLETNEVTPCSH